MRENIKIYLKLFFCLLLLFFAWECGESMPVEEMGNAKYIVSKAESVKAEKYATEKYESAKRALFAAHDAVLKGDMDLTKKKAIEASRLAQEAFDISIPKFAKASKEYAEALIDEANQLSGAEFAEAEFKNSKDFLVAGNQNMMDKNHKDAVRSYEDSAQAAGKAKDIAEAQIETMKLSVLEIEDKLEQANKYGAGKEFPKKLKMAKSSLRQAKDYLNTKKYVIARAQLEKVNKLTQELLDKSLKKWAKSLYQDVKKYVNKIDQKLKKFLKVRRSDEKKNILNSTKITMKAAKESLVNAGKLIKDEAYQNSKDESEEANRLARIVQDQLAQFYFLSKKSKAGGMMSSSGKGWKQYVVKRRPSRRDCLWRIAEYQEIYANPYLWSRIYKANKSKIKNPDLIYPGQNLDIPPKVDK